MKEKVKALEPWYQTIRLDSEITTPGREECGDHLWLNMKKILPFSLEGKRVLDLGCNAGRYCIGASLLGASEVIGIEAKEHWHAQAILIKEWFEKKQQKKLNVSYLLGDMRTEIDSLSGRFDIVFAIASLYYLKEGKEEFLEKLCNLTDCILFGYRPGQGEAEIARNFAARGVFVSEIQTDIISERVLVLYNDLRGL